MPTWEQQIGKIECMPLICLVNTRDPARIRREEESQSKARVEKQVYNSLVSDEEANDKKYDLQRLVNLVWQTQVETENTESI